MRSSTLLTALAAATAIAALPFALFADDPEEPGADPVPDVWAEITYDDIPAEVTNRTGALIPLDAVAYIQTGLMCHFDAIHNVGIDKPHNPTATEWKNLASGYRDGNCPIKAVKASSNPASNAFTLVLADGTERTLSSAPCVDTLNGDAVNPAADRAARLAFFTHPIFNKGTKGNRHGNKDNPCRDNRRAVRSRYRRCMRCCDAIQ